MYYVKFVALCFYCRRFKSRPGLINFVRTKVSVNVLSKSLSELFSALDSNKTTCRNVMKLSLNFSKYSTFLNLAVLHKMKTSAHFLRGAFSMLIFSSVLRGYSLTYIKTPFERALCLISLVLHMGSLHNGKRGNFLGRSDAQP